MRATGISPCPFQSLSDSFNNLGIQWGGGIIIQVHPGKMPQTFDDFVYSGAHFV